MPIEVEYQLEGSRLDQKLGQLKFQEKWLLDILKSKEVFLNLVRF
jgi:hypothetical protein